MQGGHLHSFLFIWQRKLINHKREGWDLPLNIPRSKSLHFNIFFYYWNIWNIFNYYVISGPSYLVLQWGQRKTISGSEISLWSNFFQQKSTCAALWEVYLTSTSSDVEMWVSGLRWSCCSWEIHSELLKIFSTNLEHSNVPTFPYYIKLKYQKPVSISRPIKNNRLTMKRDQNIK